jgi:hypothetical protein
MAQSTVITSVSEALYGNHTDDDDTQTRFAVDEIDDVRTGIGVG